MAQDNDITEYSDGVLKGFEMIYSKIKRLENEINIDKKQVTISDISILNSLIHQTRKDFKAFHKIVYQGT